MRTVAAKKKATEKEVERAGSDAGPVCLRRRRHDRGPASRLASSLLAFVSPNNFRS